MGLGFLPLSVFTCQSSGQFFSPAKMYLSRLKATKTTEYAEYELKPLKL
jgi:hypothetical protein